VASQALILAGGLGTRLGDITKETPKPILPVAGTPFLKFLLWNLKRNGIHHVTLSTGYLADRVMDTLGDGSDIGMELDYCEETEPLGTGGATKLASSRLADTFFVLNGDTLFDVNYWALRNLLRGARSGAIALREVSDVARYGGCILQGDRITAFQEKGATGPGVINAGVYALTQDTVQRLPKGASSLERDLFPQLVAEEGLAGLISDGLFIDIGLPETLEEATMLLPRWRKKPCAFLDRDGVLNVNTHHTYRTTDLQWIAGSREAVRWLNDAGFLVIVVTNQAGIGKGIYRESDFHHFMAQMQADLHASGAHLDDVYFCPYHPTEGIGDYLQDSPDRKPKPGMILRALRDWEIDSSRSFLVGDHDTDIEAAERAGIPGYKFSDGDHLLSIVKKAASKS